MPWRFDSGNVVFSFLQFKATDGEIPVVQWGVIRYWRRILQISCFQLFAWTLAERKNFPTVIMKLLTSPLLKVGYSRICACAGLLFMWGHRKLSSSVCARSSLISGNNTRVAFIASQFNSLRSEEVSKIFWAFLSDNPSITTYWGNMTSRKEYYASRDASKVYQSVSILLFSSM
jgi:hypothetical protein